MDSKSSFLILMIIFSAVLVILFALAINETTSRNNANEKLYEKIKVQSCDDNEDALKKAYLYGNRTESNLLLKAISEKKCEIEDQQVFKIIMEMRD